MKLMKAMKKLKFWSRKSKNKNKFYYYKDHQYILQPPYFPPPPPPPPPPLPPARGGSACQCHFCHPVEPSAPPLPPWLESQLSMTRNGTSDPNCVDPFTPQDGDCQAVGVSHEISDNTRQPFLEVSEASSSSYQQRHDLPLVLRREKPAAKKLFGCAISAGSFLIRCFFPCFNISEPQPKLKSQYV